MYFIRIIGRLKGQWQKRSMKFGIFKDPSFQSKFQAVKLSDPQVCTVCRGSSRGPWKCCQGFICDVTPQRSWKTVIHWLFDDSNFTKNRWKKGIHQLLWFKFHPPKNICWWTTGIYGLLMKTRSSQPNPFQSIPMNFRILCLLCPEFWLSF